MSNSDRLDRHVAFAGASKISKSDLVTHKISFSQQTLSLVVAGKTQTELAMATFHLAEPAEHWDALIKILDYTCASPAVMCLL